MRMVELTLSNPSQSTHCGKAKEVHTATTPVKCHIPTKALPTKRTKCHVAADETNDQHLPEDLQELFQTEYDVSAVVYYKILL